MGFFDVIDDIAGKQVLKTDTGDNRIFGVLVGTVTDNYNENMPGRVCVMIPVRDKKANVLQWARMAMMSGGDKYGTYFLPEVGDQVLVVFEQGNIEKPYVIGCLPKDASQFVKKAADDRNQTKRITTKNGNVITFFDHKEGDGEKDSITISTATQAYTFTMDNEKKTVSLSDKEKKNYIEMKTENGQMTIKAEKKLTIEVGDIKLIMNSSNNTTELTTGNFKVNANNNINLESNAKFVTKGGDVKMEANSGMSLSSSGLTSLAGNVIKLG